MRAVATLVPLLFVAALARPATAQPPLEAARGLLAAGMAAELPAFMGGDRAKAETLFTRALDLDPHQTGGRLELARLYLGLRRWTDAARELQAVMDETTPTDRPRWAMSDLPRARAMLVELRERGRVPGIAPQSP